VRGRFAPLVPCPGPGDGHACDADALIATEDRALCSKCFRLKHGRTKRHNHKRKEPDDAT
jgi:hypothetical protein